MEAIAKLIGAAALVWLAAAVLWLFMVIWFFRGMGAMIETRDILKAAVKRQQAQVKSGTGLNLADLA